MWGKKKELYVLAFQMKKRSQGRKGGAKFKWCKKRKENTQYDFGVQVVCHVMNVMRSSQFFLCKILLEYEIQL